MEPYTYNYNPNIAESPNVYTDWRAAHNSHTEDSLHHTTASSPPTACDRCGLAMVVPLDRSTPVTDRVPGALSRDLSLPSHHGSSYHHHPYARTPDSSSQAIRKTYQRDHIRRLKAREYRRLRAVVPAIAHKDNVTKVTVIEEAIKYIDKLHQALVARIQAENEYEIEPEQGPALAREMFHQAKDSLGAPKNVLSERNRSPSPPPHPPQRVRRQQDHQESMTGRPDLSDHS